MFPNPQDVLPLPPSPGLDRYRKLAKELVKACRSPEPDAISRWCERWVIGLARAGAPLEHARAGRTMDRAANDVEEFALRLLRPSGRPACVLANAQLVIARSHGFSGWTAFAEHLDRLAHEQSDEAAFEAAADAIVSGDESSLRRLLAAHPDLVRRRSKREHGATLLHYVSANGVEGYRQRTPRNIVAIARLLLDAGADVDAEADVYGGGSTTLGLAATSAHPRRAGVQLDLLDLLLDRGARIEHPNLAGNGHGAVTACLANGCPEAAERLAGRGAPLGLVDAAGIGRLDVVRSLLDQGNRSAEEVNEALRYACFYGHQDVAAWLLDHGADVAHRPADGQTPAHYAAMGGRLDVLELLLARGAPLDARNAYGGDVLGQALWSAAHGGDQDVYAAIIERLIRAGATPGDGHPPVNARIDALLAVHGSRVVPEWRWTGDERRQWLEPR